MSLGAFGILYSIYGSGSAAGLWRYLRKVAELEVMQTAGAASFILIDVGKFKQVNDTLGHDCGDLVLNEAAAVLRREKREEDLLFRAGGEEFALILPGVPPAGGREAAERMRRSVEAAVYPEYWTVTASAGATGFDPAAGAGDAMRLADNLLYQAKNRGRNQIRLAEDTDPVLSSA